jgi:lipase (class 3)
MTYAFDEFWPLVRGPSRDGLPTYLCALVAELAYYHVPQFEIDAPKRAKLLVPSEGYRRIVTAGIPTDVRQTGFERAFVAEDRGVIAIGFAEGDKLFIGFRGTAFLFEMWRINLRTPLVAVGQPWMGWPWFTTGRLHRGFAEEAMRISIIIRAEIEKLGGASPKEVYVSGHSLGGAVAAISAGLLGIEYDRISTEMFGAPRYADAAYYFSHINRPPLQIKRDGDIIPTLPPKWMGYADHPREFDTRGNPSPALYDRWPWLWRFALFSGTKCKPHWIEGYRQELGSRCKIPSASQPLTNHKKLTKAEVLS